MLCSFKYPFSCNGLLIYLQVSCVLVGFDPHINYMKMTKAASYIRKNGTLFVATNEDTHLPLAGDLVVPGELRLLKRTSKGFS